MRTAHKYFFIAAVLFFTSNFSFAQLNPIPDSSSSDDDIAFPLQANSVSSDPCNNTGFENADYAGWYRFVGWTSSGSIVPFATYPMAGYIPPGNTFVYYNDVNMVQNFSLFNTPPTNNISGAGYDPYARSNVYTIPYVDPFPSGGAYSCRIGNTATGYNKGGGGKSVDIEYVYTVPANHPYFVYDFACVMSQTNKQLSGSQCGFRIKVMNMAGVLLPVANNKYEVDINAAVNDPTYHLSPFTSNQLSTGWKGDPVYYKNWTRDSFNLCAYVGQNIRVSFEAVQGIWGDDFCYAYVDGSCNYSTALNTAIVQNKLCPDPANFALIGPAGFPSYQWYDSNNNPISAAQTGNQQTLDLNAYVNNCPAGNCSLYDGETFYLSLNFSCGSVMKVSAVLNIPKVTLSSFSSGPTCKEANNGSLAVNVGGGMGSGTYNFSWYANNCSGTSLGSANTLNNVYPGNYCVHVTSGFCPPLDTILKVPFIPMAAQYKTESLPPCLDSIAFINTNANNNSYAWYKNNLLLPNENTDSLKIDPLDFSSTYAVTYLDSTGCKDSLNIAPDMKLFQTNFLAVYCPKDSVAILYLQKIYNLQNIQWFKNGTAVSDSLGGKSDSLNYLVDVNSLSAYSATYEDNGCKKLANFPKEIFPGNIFLPDTTVNTFTPNNDGINDIFFPFKTTDYSGKQIDMQTDNFELNVFNRWGKLVFHSENYSGGWDGRNNMSEPQSDGTYFWIATFKSNCSNDNGKITDKGYVNLAR